MTAAARRGAKTVSKQMVNEQFMNLKISNRTKALVDLKSNDQGQRVAGKRSPNKRDSPHRRYLPQNIAMKKMHQERDPKYVVVGQKGGQQNLRFKRGV